MSTGCCLPLDAIQDRDVDAAGPKAVALARMRRAGLPVPDGFFVPASAYRDHLRAHGLLEQIKTALPDLARATAEERRRMLAEIRRSIIEAPTAELLTDSVRKQMKRLGEVALAVRSSATSEDSQDRSFAGQHDSHLGLKGDSACVKGVKGCWASLWSERAFEYRERFGVDHLETAMAVIVQQLVPADAAGAVFTANPVSGASECLTIEASFGLGPAVMSGSVSPDRLVLSKQDLRVQERTIATKRVELVLDAEGGVRQRPLPQERVDQPALGEADARRLGELAVAAEKVFECPLDLEWALAGGRLYLVQARPITGTRAKSWEDRQVWTNANAGEVLPDVITPMTWSLIEQMVIDMFGVLGVVFGDAPLFSLVAGRVYFNLNTFMGMLRSMPGIRGRTVGELFGGRHGSAADLNELDIPAEDIPDLGINRFRTALKVLRLAGQFLTHTPRRGERYVIRLGEETEAMRRSAWRSLSDAALAKRMQEVIDSIGACTDGFVFAAIGILYGLGFFNLCDRWLGDGAAADAAQAVGGAAGGGGRSVASRLLAGLGTLDNAEAGLALWRLARLAHEHPEVRQPVLSSERFEELRPKLAATEGGRAFLEGWESFLWCHGHHTRGEVELANARWSETPDYVLELLQSHLSGVAEVDPIARSQQLAEERARLAAECRRRLRNPIKRICFAFMLKRAQDGAPLRENLKSEYMRRGTLVRAMLLELGGRLAARGTLDETDDIFFLRLPEVEPLVGGVGGVGGEAGFDVRATVGARRAEYDRNLTLDPPPVVVGCFDPQRHVLRPVDAGTDRLEGLAVSPGVVRGRARVILRAGTDRVAPGEVLVAPFTDPGWTPYFLNAAGIVMDMGGLLSHGSIIAREYGIPCVVNVGPATKIIHTGAMVEVDGDRGVVRVLVNNPKRSA